MRLNPFKWFSKPAPKTVKLESTRRPPNRAGSSYNRASGFNSYNSFPDIANQRRTPSGRQFSELNTTRARMRWLFDNDGLTKSICEITLDNAIGPELPRLRLDNDKLKPAAKRRITEAFECWADTPEECDFLGRHNLYMMVSLMVRAFVLEGESFIRIHRNPLRLEVIDPGRIPVYTSEGVNRQKGLYQLGAQVDLDGRITHWAVNSLIDNVGYRSTYTQFLSSDGTALVPVKDILHLYDPNEAGSFRGEPDLKSAMASASTLLDYNEAALKNAKFGAERVGMIKRAVVDDDAFGGGVNTGKGPNPNEDAPVTNNEALLESLNTSTQLDGSGTHVNVVPDDYSFESYDTRYPDGQYAGFTEAHMRQIAAAGGTAYHSVSGDLRGVNFSSGRIGEQQQLRRAARLQKLMNSQVMNKIVTLFLGELLMDDTITPRQHNNCKQFSLVYTKGFSIDPLKKVQAEAVELANGTRSRREIISSDGRDPDAVLDAVEAENLALSSTKQETSNPKGDEPGDDEATDDDTDADTEDKPNA